LLDGQLANLEEMAHWIAAYVAATVLDDERALTHPDFVRSLDPETVVFDPDGWRECLARCRDSAETWGWRLAPLPFHRFRPERMAMKMMTKDMDMEDEEEVALKIA